MNRPEWCKFFTVTLSLVLVACRESDPPVAWVEFVDGDADACHDIAVGREEFARLHSGKDGWVGLNEPCSESVQGSDYRARCENYELAEDVVGTTTYLGQFEANAESKCLEAGGIWRLL